MDARLHEAYRQTLFVAEVPSGRVVIRIGKTNQLLNELLDTACVGEWAFITASNPASVPLAPEVNRARNAELQIRIDSLSLVAYPGFGKSTEGEWPPEESFLVLGVDRSLATEIGREFGQYAIVVGDRGGPAMLVGCLASLDDTP